MLSGILLTSGLPLSEKDLKAGLRKVLSGNLEFLMLSLMMPPEQFEAYRLRQAMEGLGTDEETLLEILCTRTAQQLSNITATYNKEFKRNLEKDLVSDTSGDFSRLLVALLKKECQPALLEQDVKALSEELNGKKADAWIRILTTRDPLHLRNGTVHQGSPTLVWGGHLVLIYLEAEKGQSASEIIEKHFGGIFSGDFRLGLETLVRCIENSDLYLAQRIRTMKWPVVQGVMVSHSEEDLVAVRVAYKQEAGTSLYTALQGEKVFTEVSLCGIILVVFEVFTEVSLCGIIVVFEVFTEVSLCGIILVVFEVFTEVALCGIIVVFEVFTEVALCGIILVVFEVFTEVALCGIILVVFEVFTEAVVMVLFDGIIVVLLDGIIEVLLDGIIEVLLDGIFEVLLDGIIEVLLDASTVGMFACDMVVMFDCVVGGIPVVRFVTITLAVVEVMLLLRAIFIVIVVAVDVDDLCEKEIKHFQSVGQI
ncbi:hypothetical protein P4O66_007348 [Electrophorus voltai]|uniref:Annexin n=1 Tax=Electrophorus voltai TaxID=2609070 RepID=A0AAD9DZS6_9TELE|nr:hypothetical protein P4O66_007348 [Electrophorus voltai]